MYYLFITLELIIYMSFIPDSMTTIIVEETLLTLYIASIYRYLIIYMGRIAEQQVLNLSPDKK